MPSCPLVLVLVAAAPAAAQTYSATILQPAGWAGSTARAAIPGQQAGSVRNGASQEHAAVWAGTAGSFVDLHPVAYFCYANCGGSTGAPLLDVNDFVCFQGRFAAGCP